MQCVFSQSDKRNNQYNKEMQELVQYLFKKHINSTENQLFTSVTKMKAVSLSTLRPGQEQLNLIQYLLAKNILSFSPTALTITLNLSTLLTYQRIYKLRSISLAHFHTNFVCLLDAFISNQFLPVAYSQKSIHAIIHDKKTEKIQHKPTAKGKKSKDADNEHQKEQGKNIEEYSHYSRLFYEYSSNKDQEPQYIVNLEELNNFLKWTLIEKQLGKARLQEYSKNYEGKIDNCLMLWEVSRDQGARGQLAKKIAAKAKEEKVEEYLLQLFRKYDQEQEESCAANCLLVFNLLRRNPLSNEKELLGQSLLQSVALRKCLNLLVQEGLVFYYPQGPRSLVYRIREYSQIQEQLKDRVAKSCHNVQVLMESGHLPKDQLLKLESMLWALDDTLLLFI